jgi:hypothetical protein
MLELLRKHFGGKAGDKARLDAAVEQALLASPMLQKIEAEARKEIEGERREKLQALAAIEKEEADYCKQAGPKLKELQDRANELKRQADLATAEFLQAQREDFGRCQSFENRRFALMKFLERIRPVEYDQLAENLMQRWRERAQAIVQSEMGDIDQSREEDAPFRRIITAIRALAYEPLNVAEQLRKLSKEAEAMLQAPLPVVHCPKHKTKLTKLFDSAGQATVACRTCYPNWIPVPA